MAARPDTMTRSADNTPAGAARRTAPRRGEAREALMQAALELVSTEANFSAISLRRIARQAGVVPTAFYRHFEDLDALGLTLVEETFRELRRLLQDADLSALPLKGLTRHSVELFAHHVRDNRLLFQFVVKERFSGTAPMRAAIHDEIRVLTHALAAIFARFDEFSHIAETDLRMLSDLVVNTVIALSERILEVAANHPEDTALMLRAEKQLRLIFMGVGQWESRPEDRDETDRPRADG
ncbi:TetR family transcriptional regulator [Salinisphaera orenii MK-B5]|uniref:TetR family transcriptional regulator n=2 Tax=Salinisphaera TaxID=180541 RepID=A0A423PQB7_9GAMM|nr:TetR family transcriptional regulator [Salinisphaera orenii MK-B5]